MLWPKKETDNTLIEPKIVLDGPRILMRPPTLHDWQSWYDVRSKNRAYLKPYEPSWPAKCLTPDFFIRRLKYQYRDWRFDRSKSFLILKEANHELIGGLNINNICRGVSQQATLGYWIDEGHQGQGYMSEAIKLTLDFCFTDLNLNRVNASCILKNERSKNLLLSNGFHEEGYAKAYLKIDGVWQDHYLFGITKDDWQVLKTS